MKKRFFNAILNDKAAECVRLRVYREDTNQWMYCWPWARWSGRPENERLNPEEWAEENVRVTVALTPAEYRAVRRYRRNAAAERRAARRRADGQPG